MTAPRTRITHVAIRFQGVVYSLPPPNRHHDVIRAIIAHTGVSSVDDDDDDDDDEQGFLDESGRFLSRRQAIVSARLFNQIKDPGQVRAGELTSEDLW